MNQPTSNTSSPYNEPQTVPSDHAQGPPRKKMRKGTKSCLECRRRKIKCNFEPGRPACCNECYARGSTCVDQEHGDLQSYAPSNAEQTSYSLRERVSQLEDLVKQVLHRLPERNDETASNDDNDKSEVDAQAAEVLKSLKSSLRQADAVLEESVLLPAGMRDDAPALSLFDNEVITRKESQPVISRAQYNKSKALITALNQLLPPLHDLEIILENSHEWWVIWRKMFPEITDSRCETIKESVSHSLRSEKPAEIAKIMLCIAIGVHQLPSNFNWSALQMKEEPAELMERYIATIDRLITSDDEIAATLEGIECMMLEAKYHVNMGRPRRAWLLFHRGIAFSQLLGFHRLAAQPSKSNPYYQRQSNLWCHLIIGDRYLSLLLGLPYSVSDAFVAPYIATAMASTTVTGEVFIAKMLPVVSKLNDRNQSVVPMGYSATLRLDQDLEELHNAQDSTWWSTDLLPGATPDDHFDRLQGHFFYHQARLLLHLPFMLRSSTDKRYQYSHTAALDASREMIQVYDALRSNTAVGPYICKLIDFQTFTAAMLLLLNLCGYSQAHRPAHSSLPDHDQNQRDSDLIDHTIDLLKDASKEAGGVVATQSAQALEMLARVRQGCAGDEQCHAETCQVSIPYFGTISIGMGKQFVPIKPGTYVSRAPGRAGATATTGVVPNSGLPTPPSLSSGSTQQSPLATTIDNHRQSHRPPVYESTDYIAPGLDQPWPEGDDHLITFDSFMAFPAQGPMDFPSSSATGSSGFTPQQRNQSPYSQPMNDFNTDMSTGSLGNSAAQTYPFASFPFNPSNLDLDQGWNWFGVEAPLVQQ